MNLSITGLPALLMQVGFVVVFSAPVWLAARLVGADNPTLLRSALSLIVGTIGAFVSLFAASGGWVLLCATLAFLLAFKFILGTSFFGSILLAVVALLGYATMIHFIGAGFNVTSGTTTV